MFSLGFGKSLSHEFENEQGGKGLIALFDTPMPSSVDDVPMTSLAQVIAASCALVEVSVDVDAVEVEACTLSQNRLSLSTFKEREGDPSEPNIFSKAPVAVKTWQYTNGVNADNLLSAQFSQGHPYVESVGGNQNMQPNWWQSFEYDEPTEFDGMYVNVQNYTYRHNRRYVSVIYVDTRNSESDPWVRLVNISARYMQGEHYMFSTPHTAKFWKYSYSIYDSFGSYGSVDQAAVYGLYPFRLSAPVTPITPKWGLLIDAFNSAPTRGSALRTEFKSIMMGVGDTNSLEGARFDKLPLLAADDPTFETRKLVFNEPFNRWNVPGADNVEPVAFENVYGALEDASNVRIDLAGFDADDGLKGFIIKSVPAQGVLYLNAAKTVVATVGAFVDDTMHYSPVANFNGDLVFQVAAVDLTGLESTAHFDITIRMISVNDLPNVTIGNDVSVAPDEMFALTSSATDIDGTIASYEWTTISGVDIVFANANDANTTGTAPRTVNGGSSICQVKVTDDEGGETLEQMTVSYTAHPFDFDAPLVLADVQSLTPFNAKWTGMCVVGNDIFACEHHSQGKIWVQRNGSGDFEQLGDSLPYVISLTEHDGKLYYLTYNNANIMGEIDLTTGETTPLHTGMTARHWHSFIEHDGIWYFVDSNNGDIYTRVGFTGDAIATQSGSNDWRQIVEHGGDIYATAYATDYIHKLDKVSGKFSVVNAIDRLPYITLTTFNNKLLIESDGKMYVIDDDGELLNLGIPSYIASGENTRIIQYGYDLYVAQYYGPIWKLKGYERAEVSPTHLRLNNISEVAVPDFAMTTCSSLLFEGDVYLGGLGTQGIAKRVGNTGAWTVFDSTPSACRGLCEMDGDLYAACENTSIKKYVDGQLPAIPVSSNQTWGGICSIGDTLYALVHNTGDLYRRRPEDNDFVIYISDIVPDNTGYNIAAHGTDIYIAANGIYKLNTLDDTHGRITYASEQFYSLAIRGNDVYAGNPSNSSSIKKIVGLVEGKNYLVEVTKENVDAGALLFIGSELFAYYGKYFKIIVEPAKAPANPTNLVFDEVDYYAPSTLLTKPDDALSHPAYRNGQYGTFVMLQSNDSNFIDFTIDKPSIIKYGSVGQNAFARLERTDVVEDEIIAEAAGRDGPYGRLFDKIVDAGSYRLTPVTNVGVYALEAHAKIPETDRLSAGPAVGFGAQALSQRSHMANIDGTIYFGSLGTGAWRQVGDTDVFEQVPGTENMNIHGMAKVGSDIYFASTTEGILKQFGGIGPATYVPNTPKFHWVGMVSDGTDLYVTSSGRGVYAMYGGNDEFIRILKTSADVRGVALLGTDLYISTYGGQVEVQRNRRGSFTPVTLTSKWHEQLVAEGSNLYSICQNSNYYMEVIVNGERDAKFMDYVNNYVRGRGFCFKNGEMFVNHPAVTQMYKFPLGSISRLDNIVWGSSTLTWSSAIATEILRNGLWDYPADYTNALNWSVGLYIDITITKDTGIRIVGNADNANLRLVDVSDNSETVIPVQDGIPFDFNLGAGSYRVIGTGETRVLEFASIERLPGQNIL